MISASLLAIAAMTGAALIQGPANPSAAPLSVTDQSG